jgi:hypothetical protein
MEETEQTTIAIHKIEDRVACRAKPWVSTEEAHDRSWQIGGNNVENLTRDWVVFNPSDQDKAL